MSLNANPRTGAKFIKRTERDLQIIELRLAGWSFEMLGQKFQLSRLTCFRIVDRWLTEKVEMNRDKIEQLRFQEVQKLERLELALYSRVFPYLDADGHVSLDNHNALLPVDYDAIDRYLKVMARKAALQGLDAPVKVTATDPSGKVSMPIAITRMYFGERPAEPAALPPPIDGEATRVQ